MTNFSEDDMDELVPMKKWPPAVGLAIALGGSVLLWYLLAKFGGAVWTAVFG